MSDPRATVSHEGVGYEAEPFVADGVTIVYSATAANGSTSVGLACTRSAAKTAALAADGEAILGKLIKVESDGICVVQTGGYMTLPGGTGATLTRGKKIVGALLSSAKGYIREVAVATAAELGIARGSIEDATTTTAVLVRLEKAA